MFSYDDNGLLVEIRRYKHLSKAVGEIVIGDCEAPIHDQVQISFVEIGVEVRYNVGPMVQFCAIGGIFQRDKSGRLVCAVPGWPLPQYKWDQRSENTCVVDGEFRAAILGGIKVNRNALGAGRVLITMGAADRLGSSEFAFDIGARVLGQALAGMGDEDLEYWINKEKTQWHK